MPIFSTHSLDTHAMTAHPADASSTASFPAPSRAIRPKTLRLLALIACVLALGLLMGCVTADTQGTATTRSTTSDATTSTISKSVSGSAASASASATSLDAQVASTLAGMTTEQKVAQLFFITPEALTNVGTVTQAGDTTKRALATYPVGGIVYFSKNIESADQFSTMIANTKSFSTIPLFIGIDEEGGTQVARLANSGKITIPTVDDAINIGATGDSNNALSAATTIGTYLAQYGFNVDFAPDCDVVTDASTAAIGVRSFGGDPTLVSQMVAAEVQGLQSKGVHATLKHFPGYGSVAANTDTDIATSTRTLDELNAIDLLPFQAGIAAGAQLVMVGNVTYPAITGDNTPACLSSKIVTDLLRTQLGFDGIVITDAQNASAITDTMSSGDAAVAVILAGGDMILMPADFTAAYNAVLAAVQNGTISEARLDQSVTRILEVKLAG